ncbi:DUF4124 domain-containing protein [Hydrogenophaga sp. RWCD_12]|uniref:DUF4124 domain-containing protein n=1 Tax=Hydrogenophaga sp. RWCD_12 TaxID=3391190 RepID=UPI003984D57B
MTRPLTFAASPRCLRLTGAGLLALVLGAPAWAQDIKNQGGIYSCIDSKGRRLTSDRPIVDCLDREQKELGNSGTVKRVVPPSYTAEEKARLEAQRRVEDAEKARVAEEKRRDKALLIRYPNQGVHDKERVEALKQIDDVIDAVKKRVDTLAKQRRDIDLELEFYQSDPKKAPAWLQRKLDDNSQQVQVQNRFLGEQSLEKQRINARFDEELAKLKMLWTYGIKP